MNAENKYIMFMKSTEVDFLVNFSYIKENSFAKYALSTCPQFVIFDKLSNTVIGFDKRRMYLIPKQSFQ